MPYTPEALAAILKNPQDRSQAVKGAVEKLGGKIERFWLSFGDYDTVGIVQMPDSVSAAAFSMAVGAGGPVVRQDDLSRQHGKRCRSDEEGGDLRLQAGYAGCEGVTLNPPLGPGKQEAVDPYYPSTLLSCYSIGTSAMMSTRHPVLLMFPFDLNCSCGNRGRLLV